MADRVFVRDLAPDEGQKRLRIIRRGTGSVVRWRRAQIVLWSAQRMSVPAIAEIAFTSEDRVGEVVHNFNADGFDSLAPKYAGGRPPTFTIRQRRAIKKVALSRPGDHGGVSSGRPPLSAQATLTSHGDAAGGPRSTDLTVSATSWPAMTCPPTGSMATSSTRKTGPRSCGS